MFKPHLTLSATLALAALGGCALSPDYQRPQAPVAANYAVTDATPNAAPVATLEWQSFFTDPALRRLIELALANNRDLRVAVLNIEQARAQFQIRRADQFPTINLGASGSRAPVASRSTGANSSTASGSFETFNAGLVSSAYELDFFGRVASLKDAALSQYLATEESRKTAQISLIAAVATAYLNVLGDEAQLDVVKQTLGTREESQRLTKLRFDNGASSELDFRQAQSLTEAARVTLAQLKRQRVLDENALTLLVGQPLPADWLATTPAAQTLEQAVLMGDLPAGLPSDLLTQRPDIRAAERQLLATNANIGAARAAFFPRISLTGGYGSTSSELSGLFKAGTYGWSFAPQIALPIFDAGRNQANLEVAKVNKDIAVAQYEKAIQTAFREVADALGGRAALAEQFSAQLAQAEAEAARFKLSDLRYRNGVASFLDALDAQRTLLSVRLGLLQTRLLQLQSQVALYKSLGGGWREPATASAVNAAPDGKPPAQ